MGLGRESSAKSDLRLSRVEMGMLLLRRCFELTHGNDSGGLEGLLELLHGVSSSRVIGVLWIVSYHAPSNLNITLITPIKIEN